MANALIAQNFLARKERMPSRLKQRRSGKQIVRRPLTIAGRIGAGIKLWSLTGERHAYKDCWHGKADA